MGEQEDVFQKMKYTGVLTSFTQQGNQMKLRNKAIYKDLTENNRPNQENDFSR